jgi:hypothetical protein
MGWDGMGWGSHGHGHVVCCGDKHEKNTESTTGTHPVINMKNSYSQDSGSREVTSIRVSGHN